MDFNNTDIQNFNDNLNRVDWLSIINNNNDIDLIYDSLMYKIVNIYNTSFKTKNIDLSRNRIPNAIKAIISKKSKLYKLYYQTNDKFFYIGAQHLYNKIGVMLENFYSMKIQKLIDKNDNFKSFYKNIKSNIKSETCNSFFDSNNRLVTDSNNVANAFSKYFCSNFTPLSYPNYQNLSNSSNERSLTEVCITQTDVMRELLKLNTKKSVGHSEIPTFYLYAVVMFLVKFSFYYFLKF